LALWQVFVLGTYFDTSIINLKTLKMSINIQPLSDRVLVEPQAAEEKTASGIIIPETAKEKPQRGTVVAVGKGKKDYDMTVKEGDTVIYGKYSGTELKFEDKDYLMMREDDILAIV
jgi:chaperonin GroES